MSHQDILRDLQQGKYRPVYFLHGEESYYIDMISDYVADNVLPEAERAFNQTVLYGKDIDHLTVLDIVRRYPMMSAHQVVLIKEAQDMKSLKELLGYLEKPLTSTILVISHKNGKYNLNSKFGKALKEHAVLFESKRLYDNQVPAWIEEYLRTRQLKIQPKGAELIAECLGTDLAKVANELNKLVINLPAGSTVSQQQIEEYIGISKDYNIFELQKALGKRDVLKSNRIVQYFAANPKRNPIPVVMASLYNFFSKVYMLHFLPNASEKDLLQALDLRSAFFLRDYREAARYYNLAQTEMIIALLREYDLKSKGVDYIATGKPEGDLLREMVWRALHG